MRTPNGPTTSALLLPIRCRLALHSFDDVSLLRVVAHCPKIQSDSPLGPSTNPSTLEFLYCEFLCSEKLSFMDVALERLTLIRRYFSVYFLPLSAETVKTLHGENCAESFGLSVLISVILGLSVNIQRRRPCRS